MWRESHPQGILYAAINLLAALSFTRQDDSLRFWVGRWESMPVCAEKLVFFALGRSCYRANAWPIVPKS